MECPTCYGETRVIDSRDAGEKWRRRRECLRCKERFTTYEMTADEYDRLLSVKVNMGAIREAIRALQVVQKSVS